MYLPNQYRGHMHSAQCWLHNYTNQHTEQREHAGSIRL
jgi:hypothetical protein